MPAEEPYATISLIASVYWFAYFLIILPMLGITETPDKQPDSIAAAFDAKYPSKSSPQEVSVDEVDPGRASPEPAE